MRLFRTLAPLFALALPALTACAQPPATPGTTAAPKAAAFRVTLDPSLGDKGVKAYRGRVYVTLSRFETPEPRTRMWSWFQPSQVFAIDIFGDGLHSANSVIVGPGALAYPKPYGEADPGPRFVQAVARLSPDSHEPGKGAGDVVSEVVKVDFDPTLADDAPTIELRLSRVVEPRPFPKADRVRDWFLHSAKLSEFTHRDREVECGVILPKNWSKDSTATYPVLVFIGGFGGDHTFARQVHALTRDLPGADDMIIIVPNATNYRGHSVFADSANTGPWGAMLVEELLPQIEKDFGGNGKRYVTGISSGGWSSLWLQVTYPDFFHGCWSHCPDPVDFRDFQRINLYADNANMYRDDEGNRRPLARGPGGRTAIWYDDFVAMETVMGPGGQIHSFEAVFSPVGPDGQPRPLFDRVTGTIDPVTAKAWETYDINLVVERNWDTLGPKLAGKLRVYAGENDTFLLESATIKLGETLTRLGSDAEVVVVPNMGHTIHGPGLRAMFDAIQRENPRPEGGTP